MAEDAITQTKVQPVATWKATSHSKGQKPPQPGSSTRDSTKMVYPSSVFITGTDKGIGFGLVKEFLKISAVRLVIAGALNPLTAKGLNAITDSRLKNRQN
ncbi:hypothetical protein KIN20_017571 [Parelaphostrongylus tenuis]|uniref:Uncharacterized protein n=1 Tax=Parelaphostrongylus tenuis TaxID=148309 RepID=A0AAD5MNF6_PARTN|nr:hypothetical protein KIN20_017571 [Parelaphostrongylus tenuis]